MGGLMLQIKDVVPGRSLTGWNDLNLFPPGRDQSLTLPGCRGAGLGLDSSERRRILLLFRWGMINNIPEQTQPLPELDLRVARSGCLSRSGASPYIL